MTISALGRVHVAILFRKSAGTKPELVSCRRTAQLGNRRVGDPSQLASVIAWLPGHRIPGVLGVGVPGFARNALRLRQRPNE